MYIGITLDATICCIWLSVCVILQTCRYEYAYVKMCGSGKLKRNNGYLCNLVCVHVHLGTNVCECEYRYALVRRQACASRIR